MPKILKMPKSAQPNDDVEGVLRASQFDHAFRFPKDGEEEAGIAKISRWLELADQVLTEGSACRNRA